MTHLSSLSADAADQDMIASAFSAHLRKLDDATLRDQLAALYADPSTPTVYTSAALFEGIYRRMNELGDDGLTASEWACVHAQGFDQDLCDGGFTQLIQHSNTWRVRGLIPALECIGAPWAATLVRRSLRVLPAPFGDPLTSDWAPDSWEHIPLGRRRRAYLEKLDLKYHRRRARLGLEGDIQELIVRHARQQRIGVEE